MQKAPEPQGPKDPELEGFRGSGPCKEKRFKPLKPLTLH